MGRKLKKLKDQVVVITGASSGIGLATAKLAAKRGAKVVLAARDGAGLAQALTDIRRDGGNAVSVEADVTERDDVERIGDTAVRNYGGIDTWVNNAGLSIYGEIEHVPVADARRLFDVNYWGVVHGSLVAVPHLQRRGGGALINIGSVLSDRAIPLQGHYSASKHAVKAFTDSLRMELERDGTTVSVTLIKPAAIDTPYPEHARNYMSVEPKHPAPVYAPEVVARAILECAERPKRDVIVGGGGKMTSIFDNTPRLSDRVMEKFMFDAQQRNELSPLDRRDSLYEPQRDGGHERGNYPGVVRKHSLYTAARLHPMRAVVGLAVLGAGVALARATAAERRAERGANNSSDGGHPGDGTERRPATPPVGAMGTMGTTGYGGGATR